MKPAAPCCVRALLHCRNDTFDLHLLRLGNEKSVACLSHWLRSWDDGRTLLGQLVYRRTTVFGATLDSRLFRSVLNVEIDISLGIRC